MSGFWPLSAPCPYPHFLLVFPGPTWRTLIDRTQRTGFQEYTTLAGDAQEFHEWKVGLQQY